MAIFKPKAIPKAPVYIDGPSNANDKLIPVYQMITPAKPAQKGNGIGGIGGFGGNTNNNSMGGLFGPPKDLPAVKVIIGYRSKATGEMYKLDPSELNMPVDNRGDGTLAGIAKMSSDKNKDYTKPKDDFTKLPVKDRIELLDQKEVFKRDRETLANEAAANRVKFAEEQKVNVAKFEAEQKKSASDIAAQKSQFEADGVARTAVRAKAEGEKQSRLATERGISGKTFLDKQVRVSDFKDGLVSVEDKGMTASASEVILAEQAEATKQKLKGTFLQAILGKNNNNKRGGL